jgi:dienelactone hydrolase
VSRTDVQFLSNGVKCAAWLYRPDRDGPLPLVVMAHGFSATRELRLDAYAERFAEAGLAALLFDYRHFGASDGEPRQLLDIKRQQQDFEAALAYARGLDWVDDQRLALFGSSFSGGHVLAVAARDGRVAAVISQCPFTDGIATAPKLGAVNVLKATAVGLRDQLGALAGRRPHYMAAVGEPGSFAAMTTPESKPGMDALMPEQTRWENRVAARITLRLATYRPGRRAPFIPCPVLACVCDKDSLAPADRTVALLSKAPLAEIKRYPIGHFEIYIGEWWERAVADQTEFLSRHLLKSASEKPPAESPAAGR